MSDKSKFMLRAIELSIQSAKTKGGPFGCVIVKDNKIIAEGFNQVTSNNDPTACYPSACIALDAIIHTSSRKVEAEKFFTGMFETSLKKGELVTAVEFQIPEKSCYIKFPNPASRYAMVGVYIAKFKKEVRCAVTGAQSVVYRCKEIEKALNNNFSESALDSVSLKSSNLNSDIHASAEYRASLIVSCAQKAVAGSK